MLSNGYNIKPSELNILIRLHHRSLIFFNKIFEKKFHMKYYMTLPYTSKN